MLQHELLFNLVCKVVMAYELTLLYKSFAVKMPPKKSQPRGRPLTRARARPTRESSSSSSSPQPRPKRLRNERDRRQESPQGDAAPPQLTPRESRSPGRWWENHHIDSSSRHPPNTNQDEISGLRGVLDSLLAKINSLEQLAQVKGDLVDQLHLTVPEDLKAKIWAGEFIEFKDLLKKSFKSSEEAQKVSGMQEKDGTIALKLVQNQTQKSPLSIAQWSSAFHVFMSVLLLKNSDSTTVQDLLSYAELIREAAKDNPQSPAWREYDEKFRTKKAADPTRPWGMIDNQLWLSIFCRNSSHPNNFIQSQAVRPNSMSLPAKSCFYFNKRNGCRNSKCQFRHACSNCGEPNHAFAQCPGRKSSFGASQASVSGNDKPFRGQSSASKK